MGPKTLYNCQIENNQRFSYFSLSSTSLGKIELGFLEIIELHFRLIVAFRALIMPIYPPKMSLASYEMPNL